MASSVTLFFLEEFEVCLRSVSCCCNTQYCWILLFKVCPRNDLPFWVSKWLLFSANSTIIQLYYGENKLIFN